MSYPYRNICPVNVGRRSEDWLSVKLATNNLANRRNLANCTLHKVVCSQLLWSLLVDTCKILDLAWILSPPHWVEL